VQPDAGEPPAVRLRGSSRVALTLADQVVSSVSNFATGVAVARLSGAVAFGQYALVLTIWLVLVGVHRRVVAEPMIVESRDADIDAEAIAQGLSAELVLGAVATTLIGATGLVALAAGADIGVTLLAFAPWFVPLLVQDYWRAVSYQRRRPELALLNDLVFAVAQVAAIGVVFVLGWRSGALIIGAWGLGGAIGALLGLRWFPDRVPWRHGCQAIVRMWPRGRWLLADFLSAFASQQGYLVFAALLLSEVDYGGFRAAFSLMGPTVVIMLAAGNVGLPEAARRAASPDRRELRRYVRQLSFWTTCCVALYGLALALAARPLLRVLYGTEFGRFAPLTVLVALEYVIVVSMYGQGIALRATGGVRSLWLVRIVITVASVASLVLLFRWLGLIGVGWSGVALGVYDSLAVYVVYRRGMRTDAGGQAVDGARAGVSAEVASGWAPTVPPEDEHG